MFSCGDTGEYCERVDSVLRIYCDRLDPDEVTKLLRISPTKTTRKGRLVGPNALGFWRRQPLNGWFLKSENHVHSLDIGPHLEWLLDRLEPVADELRLLQAMPGVTMLVTNIWWSAHGYGGPSLSASHMARLAALNLACSFDAYYFGPED